MNVNRMVKSPIRPCCPVCKVSGFNKVFSGVPFGSGGLHDNKMPQKDRKLKWILPQSEGSEVKVPAGLVPPGGAPWPVAASAPVSASVVCVSCALLCHKDTSP